MSLTYFPVNKGDTVVVLGAYIGEETRHFAERVGDKGIVLAVEPIEENYRYIENMISLGEYDMVKLFRGAVSDVSSMINIHLGTNTVNHSLVRDWGKGERLVPCLSWVELLKRYSINKVNLLYMDIEGAEELVLKGMNHVLPKYITLEHHEHIGVSKKPLYKLLTERGYSYREKNNRYIYAYR